MALDALLAVLQQEAGAKAEAIIAQAQAEAERITAQAEAEIARRRRDALDAAGEQAREAANARLADLRRNLRSEIMIARAQMLQRVFDRARAMFAGAPCDPAFQAALPRHLEEALAFADEHEMVTLHCRPELRALLQPLVEPSDRFTLVDDACAGIGVLLHTTTSGIRVDNTLEARLLRAHASLAIELVRTVETEDHAGVE